MAESFFSKVIPQIRKATSGKRMMACVREVVATDRWNSFDQFHKTTATMVRRLKEAKAGVEVHTIQTGGPLGSGRWLIQQAADIRSATCEVIAPVRQKLLDYRDCPWHVIQWSAATPREGLTGEIVVLDRSEQVEALEPGALTGKIVLTSQNVRTFAVAGDPGAMPRLAALGAAAVICDRPIRNLPDAVGWTKFGWGGIDLPYAASHLVGLVISQNQGLALRKLIEKHGTVTARIKADIRHYVGTHDVVCGLVRGQDESLPEVWSVAHTAEPGAVDNASGVAVSIEVAQALEELISRGLLPRPKRTIRLLLGYECYGFFHYLEHAGLTEPPVAGLCIDGVGADPKVCSGRLQWHDTVPQSAGYVNRLGERILKATLKTGNPGYRVYRRSFVATLDTLLGDPQYGFPCPWLESHYQSRGSTAYDAYHSSADVPELLSEAGLEVGATAAAAYLYYLANAGEAEVRDLLRRETAETIRQLMLPEAGQSRERVAYILAAHEQNLHRLEQLLCGSGHEAGAALAGETKRLIDAAVETAQSKLKKSPASRRRIDRRVPQRTALLTPTAENMPRGISQRIRQSGLRVWALFWADGRLNLSQIAERLSVEMGQAVSLEQVVEFFEAHEELGYVKLTAGSRGGRRR